MNKYQEVFDKVVEHLMDEWGYEGMEEEVREIMKPLQELLDKNKLRTEEEVLQDFEKLEYEIYENSDKWLNLHNTLFNNKILISKEDKCYCLGFGEPTTMEEHKLLNELFQIWNWL